MSNTKTIAKNTGWYSVENIVSAVVTVITSVAIARTLGPAKTGYIIYVSYVASVVANLGSLGIPSATRKYMAEFLGRGDKGTARLIFFRTLAIQAALATLATLAIVFWVFQDANAEFRLAAVLIALSIWPSMINSVPAQANSATENLATNVPGSVISAFVYLFTILGTVVFHWGVTGIGAALLLMRSIDLLVRFFPTMARIVAWNTTRMLPEGLRKSMIAYAWQSVATMLLALIVWERSEVLLLKSGCAPISGRSRSIRSRSAWATICFSVRRSSAPLPARPFLFSRGATFEDAATGGCGLPLSRSHVNSAALHRRGSRGSSAATSLWHTVRWRSHGGDDRPASLHAEGIPRAHPKPFAKRRAPELCHSRNDSCRDRGLGNRLVR